MHSVHVATVTEKDESVEERGKGGWTKEKKRDKKDEDGEEG